MSKIHFMQIQYVLCFYLLKGDVIFLISFKPLQYLLIRRNISKMEFIHLIDISPSTAAKMWRNEYISMKIVNDICAKLKCELTDVIEYIPD